MLNYKFYTDSKYKTFCVVNYRGHSYKGIAKCDPADEFDVTTGRYISLIRCKRKVCKVQKANLKKAIRDVDIEIESLIRRKKKLVSLLDEVELDLRTLSRPLVP